MSKGDRDHFLRYRQQTRLKHEILEAYLPAFLNVLKRNHKNLIYIDGFAGRGTYVDEDTGDAVDGSPLRALKLISERSDLAKAVSTVFIESDSENYDELKRAVDDFYVNNTNVRKPAVFHSTFADKVTELVDHFQDGDANLAPTFLFVDPCGIDGVSFDAIQGIMGFSSCEAFIFFNYQAVRRVAGLTTLSPTLIELYGSEERAQKLVTALVGSECVEHREQLIVTHYRDAIIEDVGAQYITAFRVECEERRDGSHYLLHVTKHPLGFKIMKNVMWPRGKSNEGPGGLELVQASDTGGEPLIRPGWEQLKRDILDALANGPVKVATFYSDQVMSAENVFCEPAYREALLELEAEELIDVLDKQCDRPYPMNPNGPRRAGTLAKDYYVCLRQ